MLRGIIITASLLLANCSADNQSFSIPTNGNSAPSTRYREGDEAIYTYSGSFTEHPVRLVERIISQEGNQLEIEVTATRGDERRQWIQIVTDTPENQRNNVVDELFEVVDGERRRLENSQNQDIFRLYQWTIPPLDGGLTPVEGSATEDTIELNGRQFTCTSEPSRGTSGGANVEMTERRCPTFVWTHGPARLVNTETNDIIWQVDVESDTPPR